MVNYLFLVGIAAIQKEDLQTLFDHYKNVDHEKLWENLEYFIKEIHSCC